MRKKTRKKQPYFCLLPWEFLPRISEGQFTILREWLWKKMLEPGTKPRFNNQGFSDGILHLECTDEATSKWFQQVISALSSCGRLKFTIVNNELCRTKHTGCWIPTPGIKTVYFMHTLGKQNSGIVFGYWRANFMNAKDINPQTEAFSLMFFDSYKMYKLQYLRCASPQWNCARRIVHTVAERCLIRQYVEYLCLRIYIMRNVLL